MDFKDLHNQSTPLLVCNVWDVPSALIAQNAGYQCIGTSSAAISSMLGYSDGEEMSFSELYELVVKIRRKTSVPFTVDIEAGFGHSAQEVYANIQSLAEIGVVGVNIEDSVVVEGNRILKDPTEMADMISELRVLLSQSNTQMFLNIRTDGYLIKCGSPLEETKHRITLYQEAGADGIFVPFLDNQKDISTLVDFTELPLNVMCTQHLPEFKTLSDLGVKRISMGNYAYSKLCKVLEEDLASVRTSQSFSSLFTK